MWKKRRLVPNLALLTLNAEGRLQRQPHLGTFPMSWKWLAVTGAYGTFLGNRVWDTIEIASQALLGGFRGSAIACVTRG
jgi:hypothetical protein